MPSIEKGITVAERLAPLAPAIAADIASVANNPATAPKLVEDLMTAWPVITSAITANTAAATEPASA